MKSNLKRLVTVRGSSTPVGLLARAMMQPDDMPDEMPDEMPAGVGEEVLELRFSAFGVWYEVSSWWEGRYLERVMPGSFAKTITERGDKLKIFFNHGFDMYIDEKVLGVPSVLEERADSPYAAVPLLDTSYNRDLIPALRVGAYGSSFMFNVLDERWDYEAEKSAHNPEGLPERSIYEVRLFEAGPVTWPANQAATAGLRSASLTDWYSDQLRSHDPDRHEFFVRSCTDFRAQHGFRTLADEAAPPAITPVPEPGDGQQRDTTPAGAANSPTEAPDTPDMPAAHHATGLTRTQRTSRLREQRWPFLTKEAS